jgi:hypothetical protein
MREKAVQSSETSLTIYKSAWYQTLRDSKFYAHRRENIKPHNSKLRYFFFLLLIILWDKVMMVSYYEPQSHSECYIQL